jgi:hypothetical protein
MRVMAIVNPGSDEDVPDLATECSSVGGLLGLQLQKLLHHLAEYGATHMGLDVSDGDAEETQGRLLGRWQARLSRAAMWALMAGGVQLASGHGVQAADERSGWGSGLQPLTCVSRATCVVAAATGAVVVVSAPAGVAVAAAG